MAVSEIILFLDVFTLCPEERASDFPKKVENTNMCERRPRTEVTVLPNLIPECHCLCYILVVTMTGSDRDWWEVKAQAVTTKWSSLSVLMEESCHTTQTHSPVLLSEDSDREP